MENDQNKKYWFFGSKLNTALLLVLIVLMVIALVWMKKDGDKYFGFLEKGDEQKVEQEEEKETEKEVVKPQVKDTYTYTNHGFSIELPKGFVPTETKIGPVGDANIMLSDSVKLSYNTNALSWEKIASQDLKYLRDEKIGETTFKVYSERAIEINNEVYWFRQGNVGYHFSLATGADSTTKNSFFNILKTFKFVGWPQAGCEGGYEKCVDSLAPTDIVSTKPTTYEKVGISKSELEALVKKKFGTCEAEDCRYTSIDISEATIKINGQLYLGVPLVTAVASQYDDSVAFQKTVAKLYKNESGDGVWRLSEPVITWACQQGRGHTDFSTKICS